MINLQHVQILLLHFVVRELNCGLVFVIDTMHPQVSRFLLLLIFTAIFSIWLFPRSSRSSRRSQGWSYHGIEDSTRPHEEIRLPSADVEMTGTDAKEAKESIAVNKPVGMCKRTSTYA
jgi:hypothetical protein